MSKLTRRLQSTDWNIAIIDNTLEDIINGIPLKYRVMKYNSRDTWYADPFILDVTDSEYMILAEEMQYSKGKARISKLIVDKQTMQLKCVVPLLSLPTHLSYPAIIRENDRVYVYPESGLSGKLTRYYYDQENEQLVEDCIIMDGPLADATLTNLFGDEYLFCTRLPDCNGKHLEIYKKSSDGLFKLFQNVDFSENIARMGGDFFKVGNSVYRPAQDCNKWYGNGIVIQKVELEEKGFVFSKVSRYFSTDAIYKSGLHTLNEYKGTIVVDMVGKPHYPFFHKLIKKTKKLLIK